MSKKHASGSLNSTHFNSVHTCKKLPSAFRAPHLFSVRARNCHRLSVRWGNSVHTSSPFSFFVRSEDTVKIWLSGLGGVFSFWAFWERLEVHGIQGGYQTHDIFGRPLQFRAVGLHGIGGVEFRLPDARPDLLLEILYRIPSGYKRVLEKASRPMLQLAILEC